MQQLPTMQGDYEDREQGLLDRVPTARMLSGAINKALQLLGFEGL